MSTYVIGDIQGCGKAFRKLMELISLNWETDALWFTGDLVNRGPDSLNVLRDIMSLQMRYPEQVKCVLGNHDIHLLSLYYGVTHSRKGDTLDAVIQAQDSAVLIEWLIKQPLLYRSGPYILVHAGLLPDWTSQQAEALAQEVHQQLCQDPLSFLKHIYGNTPDIWKENLTGIDRYRVILNAMTRLRFCSREGRMEFHSKGQPQHAPEEYYPWFEVPHKREPDTSILFGHWSQLGLRKMPGYVSLDSGCLWGGTLTAFRIEDSQFFQVYS